jgi:ATP-dependent Clp protease ATP-binding subunit ClpA
VVVLAQDEARALRHNYIGTEHILLGLLREEEGIAARVLESLEISVEEVRAQVAQIVGQGDEVTRGQIPFTPRAKKALDLSLREALQLGHNYIGTEHILLGLLREGEGVAVRVLMDFADPENVRAEVFNVLAGVGSGVGPYVPKSPPVAPEVGTEIERARADKEEAIDASDFERAAEFRDRERHLTRAARDLERAWAGEPLPQLPVRSLGSSQRMPRRVSDYDPEPGRSFHMVIGWLLFAVALGVGIVIGWAIWG